MQTRTRNIRRIALLGTVLLLTWTGWQAWSLADALGQPAVASTAGVVTSSPTTRKVATPPPESEPQRTVDDDAVIWQRNLRGQIGEPKKIFVPRPRPPKPVPFKLLGTMGPPGRRHAIIQRGGRQQLVSAGQTVHEAVIKEIHENRIVIEFDDRTVEVNAK